MTTTTKTDVITDRLYPPTEEEIEEYSRLYMTVENAKKTLLEQKTQTRRIINPQPDEVIDGRPIEFVSHEVVDLENNELVERTHSDSGGRFCEEIESEYNVGETRLITTPHWRSNEAYVGSDTAGVGIWDQATRCLRMKDGREVPNCEPALHRDDWHQIHASFLMPTWASRIAVEVTDVWVERLQEIDYQGMMAEGVKPEKTPGVEAARSGRMTAATPSSFIPRKGLQGRFIELWNSINGEGAWERNDWVRCVEYELITE